MDFFDHQDAARRQTGRLVALFGAAVLLIMVAVYAASIVALVGVESQASDGEARVLLWRPDVALWSIGGTLLVVALGSLFKIAQLAGGGEAVARHLGGHLVEPNTTDPAERRLLNVVEEMALASGTPVPPVFVLEEAGINAFAAGTTPANAVVGITRGCMNALSRDELQGVIAHEFSHILNGDMRLNIRLIGILHGILVLGLIGYTLMRVGFSGSGGGGRRARGGKEQGGALPIALFGLLLMAVGYIGVFFGKLIKAAVSRQREFLADASAVQFTRNPDGIGGALKKIAGFQGGSRVTNTHAAEVSHMFFANGLAAGLTSLLATHPPLEDRIRRIDPRFSGELEQPPQAARRATPSPGSVAGLAAFAATPPVRTTPEAVAAQVGAPGASHLRAAHRLHDILGDDLRQCAHEPFGARAAVYALLLAHDAAVRARQWQRLATAADPAVFAETQRIKQAVAALPPAARLPLADLAIPALRLLSEAQYRVFRANVDALMAEDSEIDLFEFAIGNVLRRHLAPVFGGAPRRAPRVRAVKDAREAVHALLSALAHFGHETETDAADAYRAAAERIPAGQGLPAKIQPVAECSLEGLADAIDRLANADPAVRKLVLQACVACVTRDGTLAIEEAECLRAIADGLECPLPPLLSEVA